MTFIKIEVTDMINIAVIGAGYWGTKLIGEYLALSKKRPDVKLYAIADICKERLLQVKDSFSLSNVILETDYDKILNNTEITGVHIATSNETHSEIASKAIKSGKHVLLEKPMCLSSSDAFKLARLAEKNASILLIGHIFRFNNSVNKIKELYEEKKIINDVRYIELKWTSLLDPLPNRDVIFDLAPHPIDILNHIFEEWPTQVYAQALSFDRQKVGLEEVAFATFSFPDNIMVSVSLSWLNHGPRERTMIMVNKNNSLKVEIVEQKITLYEKGKSKEIPIQQNNTIESEITNFVDSIKKNDPPINSALTGAMNVTVLQAMRQSLVENKAVSIF